MSNDVLDKKYVVGEIDGVEANRVVVYGEYEGKCEYPRINQIRLIAGVTLHAAEYGRPVKVRKLGIARIQASEEIKYGRPVVTGDEEGCIIDINSVTPCIVSKQIVGQSEDWSDRHGDIIDVFLTFHVKR